MSIMRKLRANRLAVVLGAGLLCSLGLTVGCDSGDVTSAAAKEDIKAKQQDEAAARKKAFGKSSVPTKASSTAKKS